ncbi:MAG: class I SAM-dependent DNA methyltransferase, partial [Bacteroidaceae bacterium]|nr:class I SAM-dependent DNA methyltransferase [Bacteroidaceae bacterium]
MDYRSIIESKYNRANWQELLHDIFRQSVQFWQQPTPVAVDASMAKSALYTGKITLPDNNVIAIYEVELSDSVVIERNRAGIRNLLCTNWRGMGCAGAFMFCFRKNEAVLRFSYVSETFAFAADGTLSKESTDTKRFTYLLGEGHRSRTAIKQFEDLKKSALDLKAITKAFSVEALSDLFFKEYKKQYEDIIEYITGKRMVKVANRWEEQLTGEPCKAIMREFAKFPDAEKAVRDYVKKLMGRLVFIQFLQKKGWMGCPAGDSWNDGDREFVQNLFANTAYKNTFVDDVLEPLFNDINTPRKGDLVSNPNVGVGIKIPYLNGGLFESDEYDSTAFPLPAKYMKNMLDFFASYNFTIDENDPDDAEIGVDPEMLGRIFENLLEDNKDKGAFYTPKEIVNYMCRESLIAYLQTDETDETIKDSIRQFVTTYNTSVLSEDLVVSVDQKLKDVKICDPAIGSGAFPMGMLHELYACRKALEGIDDETAVSIKTHIIQNNIYGVDIEKGAVDIARLRFWLALIVDEKTPHALPNMDFKIMQGNSLLEQYEGVVLSGMSINEQTQKKAKKGQAWQATFAFDERFALENIQNAIKEYYLTDDHAMKESLRGIVNDNVRNYIVNLKGCTDDIKLKIENLPIPNDKFFLWHIYFKEVFDNGGFDIVIGNPP